MAEQDEPAVAQVTSGVGKIRVSPSNSKFDKDLESKPVMSKRRFLALCGGSSSDDEITDDMAERLSVKTASSTFWRDQGTTPQKRSGLSPETTKRRLLTWFTLESNRELYGCHVTKYPFGLSRRIEFAHLIPRSSTYSELSLLEYILGMAPKGFNLHSRTNLMPLTRDLHGLIDFCRVFFLPEAAVLKLLKEYLQLVVKERMAPVMEEVNKKDKPGEESLWSRLREGKLGPKYEKLADAQKNSYRLIAVGLELVKPDVKAEDKDDDMFQRLSDVKKKDAGSQPTDNETWNPARAPFIPIYEDSEGGPDDYGYPYHLLHLISSHVHPMFIAIHAMRAANEIFGPNWPTEDIDDVGEDEEYTIAQQLKTFWEKKAKEHGRDRELRDDELTVRKGEWKAFQQFAIQYLVAFAAFHAQPASSQSDSRSTRSSQRSGTSRQSEAPNPSTNAPSAATTDTRHQDAPGDDRPSTPTPKGGSRGQKKKGAREAVDRSDSPSGRSPAALMAKDWLRKNGYSTMRRGSRKPFRWPEFLLPVVEGIRKGMDCLPVSRKVVGEND